MRSLLIGIFFCVLSVSANCQVKSSPVPYFTFGKGLGIAPPDSSFSINFRFRVQNRAAIRTASETDFSIEEVEARVRRLRLRFDGFVYSKRLTYLIQLSFSRGDMDYEAMQFPNVVRDAYVQYAVTNSFSIGLGQTKLPGNRQRVVSSGDQQFVDRSLINATFNIDRDFGLQATYKKSLYTVRGAISSGEGRNITTSDKGLSYTGRLEVYPFGQFTNGGDYFEADLAREKSPKLAIGAVYNHNDNASRTGGQLGSSLYEDKDIITRMIDFVFKYNGLSVSGEYINRHTINPITTNETGDQRYVYVGEGQNYQAGYLFKNNVEVVGRYSYLRPEDDILVKEKIKEQYVVGLNKYIKGHRVKLQSDFTLEKAYRPATVADYAWIMRLQIEVGI